MYCAGLTFLTFPRLFNPSSCTFTRHATHFDIRKQESYDGNIRSFFVESFRKNTQEHTTREVKHGGTKGGEIINTADGLPTGDTKR